VQEDSSFTKTNASPDWKKAVIIWNRKADGKEIFYKVSSVVKIYPFNEFKDERIQLLEHLQAYYNKWLRNVNEKNSISQAVNKVKALHRKHRNPERSIAAPPALQHHVPVSQPQLCGLLPQPPTIEIPQYQAFTYDTAESPEAGNNLPNSSTHTISSVTPVQTDTGPLAGPSSEAHSHKRKATTSLSGGPTRKRTCQKCGNANCGGASQRTFCQNACQDCGKMECRGRNSQHPLKDCQQGWQ
jgi:hypothetical protein